MYKVYNKKVIDIESTGSNIRNLRTSMGYTVRDIQQVFNFEHPQAIYCWEKGKTLPSIDNLLVLADLFETSIEDIIITYSVEVQLDERIGA